MVKNGENGQIRPFLPPMEIENGMDLGEMLFKVLNLSHGQEIYRLGKKKALET